MPADADAQVADRVGVAVLADGTDDGPLNVRGVALGEDDVTQGASHKRVWWPRETLESAADSLVGTKIVDDSAHDIPDDGDIPTQPPIDSIVGEVTDAHYQPGLGIVYEGQVDDPNVSALVERGRVDVSPFLFRKLGEHDPERDARKAEEIVRWRDLSVVAEGASDGASIEPAPASTAAAMSADALAEALSAAFETDEADEVDEADTAEALASFSHLEYDGTKGGKLDESAIPDDSYKSHYLFPADTKSDSSFPVVDADGNLRRGNVDAAWDLRGQAPVSKEEIERVLVRLASKFDNPPVTKEDAEALHDASTPDEPAESGADSDPEADDPASAGEDSGLSTERTMELTDSEEALVREARTLDTPAVVPADVEALHDEMAQFDDPTVVEADDFEALSERVDRVRGVLADALSERTGMKAETAEALSLDALMGEFEDEDGDFDAEALVQSPETGDAGDADEEAEALSAEEQAEAEALREDIETLKKSDTRFAQIQREQKKAELAELTGEDLEVAD